MNGLKHPEWEVHYMKSLSSLMNLLTTLLQLIRVWLAYLEPIVHTGVI